MSSFPSKQQAQAKQFPSSPWETASLVLEISSSSPTVWHHSSRETHCDMHKATKGFVCLLYRVVCSLEMAIFSQVNALYSKNTLRAHLEDVLCILYYSWNNPGNWINCFLIGVLLFFCSGNFFLLILLKNSWLPLNAAFLTHTRRGQLSCCSENTFMPYLHRFCGLAGLGRVKARRTY